jgi:hypothetical protein
LHIIERIEALEALAAPRVSEVVSEKRPDATREPPIRGSVRDYQEWLLEQLRANPKFNDASINDCAWAEQVIAAEERAERRKNFIIGLDCGGAAPEQCPSCPYARHGEETEDCRQQRALAEDLPATPRERR